VYVIVDWLIAFVPLSVGFLLFCLLFVIAVLSLAKGSRADPFFTHSW